MATIKTGDLFLLTKQQRELEKKIFENVNEETGQIIGAEELTQALVKTNGDIQKKLGDIGLLIRQRENEIEEYEKEIKRLKEIKESKARAIERARDFLAMIMEEQGLERVDTIQSQLSFRRAKSVVIDSDEDKLPKEYLKEKITYTADKVKIKETLEKGEDKELEKFAHIEEKKHLQIK